MPVTKNATDEYFIPLTDETVTRTRGIVKGGVISARIFHAFSTRAGQVAFELYRIYFHK